MRRLHWFVARHYLGASGARGLLSLITWIALGGVTVGVAALIVVVAVVSGMERDLRSSILESTPHLYVVGDPSLRLAGWEAVMERVLSIDGVIAASPFVLSQVSIIRTDSAGPLPAEAATLYGIDPDRGPDAATDMERRIASGGLARALESGLPAILLGSALADRIRAGPGDTLVLASFENMRYALGTPEGTIRQFEVAGTFATGLYEYDTRNVYTTLEAAQELLGFGPDTVSWIGARTVDPERAPEMALVVTDRLGFPYYAQSWERQNQALFDNLTLTKWAMTLMLFLIVVVAAFNIVSTLVMVVSDRTHEIGILKAMGMTRSGIVRVFVLQGAWIGIAGTVFGLAVGAGLAWMIGRYELISIPAEIYYFDHLPTALRWADLGRIVTGSLAISFLATVYPAYRAAGLEPVTAIRSE